MARSIEEVSRPRAILAIAIVFAVFIASGVVIRGRPFWGAVAVVAAGALLGVAFGLWSRRRQG